MSIACKCERCGKFYIPNQDDEITIPSGFSHQTFNRITLLHYDYAKDSEYSTCFRRVDICPKCAESFISWWLMKIPTDIRLVKNQKPEVCDH